MSKAVKGALLSGLVLPGLGQIVLKAYSRGVVIMLASLVCLVLLLVQAVAVANAVLGNLELVNAALDPAALLAEISRATADSSGGMFSVASWGLLLLWLGGAVDAWMLGRKLDLQEGGGR